MKLVMFLHPQFEQGSPNFLKRYTHWEYQHFSESDRLRKIIVQKIGINLQVHACRFGNCSRVQQFKNIDKVARELNVPIFLKGSNLNLNLI